MLTVQELIDRLNKVDDKDRLVILQTNVAGNCYEPLYDVRNKENLVYSNGVVGYDDDDAKSGTPAIILSP